MKRPIRVANCAGCTGDGPAAVGDILAGDPVDAIVGDYLAEVTIAALAGRRSRGEGRAYSEDFLRQVDGHLGALLSSGTKLVVNAGGLDPDGLAGRLHGMAAADDLSVRVATLHGDDVTDSLARFQDEGHPLTNLDTGTSLSEWGYEPLSASAYLGGWGIAQALDRGADIVVCGRVADASLLVGLAAWWHGWERDDWDALAGAVVAGHIIECGQQVTGGNFSGFTEIADMRAPAFPLAEVAHDGSCLIGKATDGGGAVTADTVTAQILYETQGPIYLNPDVTVDLRGLRVDDEGDDRVRVSGVLGSPAPETTKVSIMAHAGFENSIDICLTGLDLDRKEELIEAQILNALAGTGIELFRADRIGSVPTDPHSQAEATVLLRLVFRADDELSLAPSGLYAAIFTTWLGSIPGFYMLSGLTGRLTQPSLVMEYWPAVLAVAALDPEVSIDGADAEPVAPPPALQPVVSVPSEDSTGDAWSADPEDSVTAPLGSIVHARSGDKGGNSSVGLWTRPDAYDWLRSTLSIEGFRDLYPEAKGLPITRHELPGLCAVHFVVHGDLGRGCTSNGKFDALAKALGEFLRARQVAIPRRFLASGTRDAAPDAAVPA